MHDVVERRARIGLELVDAFTGGPLVSPSRVVVEAGDIEVVRAERSRWFVEAPLPPALTFAIDAEHYVARSITVTVPPAAQPGTLVTVQLDPRTGYPFPRSLTRIVGGVVVDATGFPAGGAEVAVTEMRGAADGATSVYRATADGQFAAWFIPAPGLSPPVADGYRIAATLVDAGTTLAGSIPAAPLTAHQRNDAPLIRLSP